MKTFLKVLVGVLLAGGLFMFAFYRTPQERVFTKNLKLAQAGDMDAAIAVAEAYMNGTGTQSNTQKAITWYKQAAAAGKPQAAWTLYQYYEQQGALEEEEEPEDDFMESDPLKDPFDEPFMDGPRSSAKRGSSSRNSQRNFQRSAPRGRSFDMDEMPYRPKRRTPRRKPSEDKEVALAYLQSTAQADFEPAQYELGNLYAQGKALPKHPGQALYWYIKAAQNEFAPAEAKVKALSTEDPALLASVEQFIQNLQAAEKDDTAAMLQVGQAYRQGNPVVQDGALAVQWYQKAWNKSGEKLSQAALELSDIYYKGEGVEPDAQKSADFLGKAAELKDPQAQYILGEAAYTDTPARFEDAFAWFSNAAAQGHVKAQYMTGFMLLQGQGTAKSVPLAIRFFEQAAEQNDASAQYVLGQIYLKGLGVRRSPRQGRAWLERAVENGSEPAKEMLGL
ncbi:MAG: SEL1-like repeat protein [Elusimicrobiaceae bacterium]|nr:SEL1-like repeat protein [Elusimicrobiaceae bacterium]